MLNNIDYFYCVVFFYCKSINTSYLQIVYIPDLLRDYKLGFLHWTTQLVGAPSLFVNPLYPNNDKIKINISALKKINHKSAEL